MKDENPFDKICVRGIKLGRGLLLATANGHALPVLSHRTSMRRRSWNSDALPVSPQETPEHLWYFLNKIGRLPRMDTTTSDPCHALSHEARTRFRSCHRELQSFPGLATTGSDVCPILQNIRARSPLSRSNYGCSPGGSEPHVHRHGRRRERSGMVDEGGCTIDVTCQRVLARQT